ncbi:pectate lyase [Streptomyces prasinosporus]|uniref:Pectate lyase n=1 Tax=Streptomyces prasinosporus TaxID=68256 RepID=A0ABP6U689_9ACTN
MVARSHRRSLRSRRAAVVCAAVVAAGVGAGVFVMNADAGTVDLYHQTLPAKDGRASSGTGTTGGTKADAAHTFTVSTRAQVVKALGSVSDTTPRVIKVNGMIDASTDDSGRKLTCADYALGTGHSLSAYLKAYDPATYGRAKLPSGAQETARAVARAEQSKNIVLEVPANTTIVGVPGTNAGLTGAMLQIQNVDDVIVRNLTFAATEDCFPQGDPTDGADGNWDSAHDSVFLRGATHVWADHNTFTDAPHFDGANPKYFGREYQIHLYDNYYDVTPLNGYAPQYSINSRARAQVVAENNHWRLPSGAKAAKLLSGDGTGSVKGSGDLVNGTVTDLVAAYNAASSKDLRTTVDWTPTLTTGLEASAGDLPTSLATTTGAGVLK